MPLRNALVVLIMPEYYQTFTMALSAARERRAAARLLRAQAPDVEPGKRNDSKASE